MSAIGNLAAAGGLPFELVPTTDAELGDNVAQFTRRRGYSRLAVNVDADPEEQLRAIADACKVLLGERSDWARPVRHLRVVTG